jgi:phage shock protein A
MVSEMSIFRRLRNILRSGANDLLHEREEPEVILERVISQMKEELREAKLQVAASIRDQIRLEKQVTDQEAKVDGLEKRARQDVVDGNDDLAKETLKKRMAAQDLLGDLQEQLEIQCQMVKRLRSGLTDLESRVNRAERKKVMLMTRMKRAEVAKRVAQTLAGFSPTDAASLLEKIESEVMEVESEVEGIQELDDSSLEKTFRRLRKDGDVDSELEKLKSDIGR